MISNPARNAQSLTHPPVTCRQAQATAQRGRTHCYPEGSEDHETATSQSPHGQPLPGCSPEPGSLFPPRLAQGARHALRAPARPDLNESCQYLTEACYLLSFAFLSIIPMAYQPEWKGMPSAQEVTAGQPADRCSRRPNAGTKVPGAGWLTSARHAGQPRLECRPRSRRGGSGGPARLSRAPARAPSRPHRQGSRWAP